MIGIKGFGLGLSDLVSPIDRVRASSRLIEPRRHSKGTADRELAGHVVLDDVTPLYAQADAALEPSTLY